MMPVIPSSIGNASLFPTSTFTSRKDYKLTKCKLFGKYTKPTFPSQNFLLPHSVRLFPNYKTSISVVQHKSRIQIIAATGTDVVVEESDSAVEGEVIDKTSEVPPDTVETTKASSTENAAPAPTARSKRTRPVRKSEMPPVKNEELIPGATFTGKVRSIQPFGAFIDFGAFTDGLIHVSQLSDGFVKDVGSIVSIGQEVKVRLLEANMETGRISLTMRESDDISKLQQRRDASAGSNSDKPRPARKNGPKPNQKREEAPKTSKFVRGQVLDGTVKNLARAGAFIALPEGEEGFLPTSEESEGFGNILGSSSLQTGQEVNVRVLRITRGQVTLTMKKEEDVEELNMRLNRGVVHVATNPFELAFRKNAAIAAFLEERERAKKFAEASDDSKKPEKIEGKVDKMKINSDALVNDKVEKEAELLIEDEILPAAENVAISEAPIADGVTAEGNETLSLSDEIASSERVITTSGETKEVVAGQADVASVSGKVNIEEMPLVEEEIPLVVENTLVGEAPIDGLVKEDSSKAEAPGETGELDSSSESVVTEEVVMSQSSDALVSDEVGTVETLLVEDRVPSAAANTLLDEATMTNVVKEVSSETESSGETVDVISPEGLVTKEFVGEAGDDLVSDKVDIGVTSVGEDHIPSAEVMTATEEASMVSAANQDGGETESLGETGGLISSSGSVVIEEALLNQTDENLIDNEREDKLMPIAEGEADFTEATVVIDEAATKLAEEDNKETDTPSEKDDRFSSSESTVSEGAVTSQADDTLVKNEEVADTSSPVEGKVSSTAVKEDTEVEPSSPEQNGSATSNEPTDVPSIQESVPRAATISPALVKQLREETGAGMMDCKRALAETGGDIVKAQEYLRKKGFASAEKKASRTTAEGRIGSYVHDNRIGVLIEVNCETDFVSRGDIFRELVDDLAMQVAACPQVQYLVTEHVPEEIVNKEREIEMQKEDLLKKPEQIRSKIVEGRIRKRLEELALLEQPYIKNDKVVVKDWVKQTIAAIGENIKVKRFARYNLGEGLEKKSQDFAAEVAAQTAAKPPPAAPKDQSSGGDKETNEKPPTVAVSAALVKQLREETGAGMMDCKKALSATGGDIEKAQEYLRKKGLSTADKKSSRLAAEGRIASYIHDSRIGVLIEVNCETDFVGRSEKFKELVDDLAMQVVACPQVQFVSVEDIPESVTNKERELEMQREDLQSKPENIRTRIVDGRVAKRLGELVLLEQPFIKNDSILIKDLVKQTVAALGENVRVRRFIRFTLGEVIEDRNPATEA